MIFICTQTRGAQRTCLMAVKLSHCVYFSPRLFFFLFGFVSFRCLFNAGNTSVDIYAYVCMLATYSTHSTAWPSLIVSPTHCVEALGPGERAREAEKWMMNIQRHIKKRRRRNQRKKLDVIQKPLGLIIQGSEWRTTESSILPRCRSVHFQFKCKCKQQTPTQPAKQSTDNFFFSLPFSIFFSWS